MHGAKAPAFAAGLLDCQRDAIDDARETRSLLPIEHRNIPVS
jgi:hypothetical protein